MTIKIGDLLPEGTLSELNDSATDSCPAGPVSWKVSALTEGKKIIVVGVPGAFTPTCSGKHLPAYIRLAADLKSKGIDEIWCISVNDVHVMGAWGRDQHAAGQVRMMADGNGTFSAALGLDVDLSKSGMGRRSRRYSMIVEDGVVRQINVEESGKFDVSRAETLLAQLA